MGSPLEQLLAGIRSNHTNSLLILLAIIVALMVIAAIIVNVRNARRNRNMPKVVKRKSGKYTGY
jgi:hypothetical protein